MGEFAFEKLEVWQDAIALSVRVYELTKTFPKSEIFALTDQIHRAVTSISANIAEGNARQSGKDQVHFTTIAFSSLMETLNHLILSKELTYINEEQLTDIRKAITKIANQLSSLRKYQQTRQS